MRINKLQNLKIDIQPINIDDTAQLLDISTATVRNWIKYNYITAIKENGNIYFDSAKIKKLKSKIESGQINRLSKRANKRTATRTFIPKEYIENRLATNRLDNIILFIKVNELDTNSSLFLLSIKLLIQENLIKNKTLSEILQFKSNPFKNSTLKKELQNWYTSLSGIKLSSKYKKLFALEIPSQKDILGLLYQSLLSEGAKSKCGSYYTPKKIVDAIIADYAKPTSKILDPCCGSGQFLLSASQVVQNVNNLYGFDIDATAIRIAKINIMLRYKNVSSLHIYNKNTLLDVDLNNSSDKFDLIITNPPWGSYYNKDDKAQIKKQYPKIKSCESFSLFLKRSIDLLKDNGILSFILPESFLYVKIHKDIREYILQNCSIQKVEYLNRIFKNVFTPVIRLDLKNCSSANNKFKVIKNNSKYFVIQNRFITNQDFVFDVNQNEQDFQLIQKVYRTNHTTLKNNAEFALGIVTGNNKKYLSKDSLQAYEEIITGKEVNKYKLGKPQHYIKFKPELYQQVALEKKYRSREKLIYKFISKKLVFAYDNKQKLTLNSANIVIPKINNYPPKVILALFNSDLYQFIFQKKFSSIKVLRSHLEQLPLPLWDIQTMHTISEHVDNILNNNNSDTSLNDFIMDKFKLTKKEKKYINESKRG